MKIAHTKNFSVYILCRDNLDKMLLKICNPTPALGTRKINKWSNYKFPKMKSLAR